MPQLRTKIFAVVFVVAIMTATYKCMEYFGDKSKMEEEKLRRQSQQIDATLAQLDKRKFDKWKEDYALMKKGMRFYMAREAKRDRERAKTDKILAGRLDLEKRYARIDIRFQDGNGKANKGRILAPPYPSRAQFIKKLGKPTRIEDNELIWGTGYGTRDYVEYKASFDSTEGDLLSSLEEDSYYGSGHSTTTTYYYFPNSHSPY